MFVTYELTEWLQILNYWCLKIKLNSWFLVMEIIPLWCPEVIGSDFLLQSWSVRSTRSSPSSARSSTSWPWRRWGWGARPSSCSRSWRLQPTRCASCRDSPSTTSPWYAAACTAQLTASSAAMLTSLAAALTGSALFQRIQYAKTDSEVISKMKGTFSDKEKKKEKKKKAQEAAAAANAAKKPSAVGDPWLTLAWPLAEVICSTNGFFLLGHSCCLFPVCRL